MKMNVGSLDKAMTDFKLFADLKNDPKRSWELLTGDWKVITTYETKLH